LTRDKELDIINEILSGDTDAFEILVEETQSKVYSLALRMTNNQEDARDMAQEAFIRAFNSLSSFRGDSRFSVWMYRLTSNICLDFLRQKKRKPADSLTMDINDDEQDKQFEIPDIRYNPETELERRELRVLINQGLLELSPDYRQILILREINGLSYEEIADVLKLEPGTVKSRIFRARKKLCSFLLHEGNLPGGFTSNI